MFAYHHVPVAKDSLVPWYLTTPEFLHPMNVQGTQVKAGQREGG